MPAALVETFGPFLIPVAIFVLGLTAYGLLVFLGRRGLLPWRTPGGTDRGRND